MITPDQRWAVWERDDFRCRHCGGRKFLSVDHIRPVKRGGTDNLDNLQTLCRSCNASKRDGKAPGPNRVPAEAWTPCRGEVVKTAMLEDRVFGRCSECSRILRVSPKKNRFQQPHSRRPAYRGYDNHLEQTFAGVL